MTKFEDQLFGQLMTDYGHQLRTVERPAPARRRVRRPVWLATGAAGAVAGVTAAVMALGSAPAAAAYSVTRQGGAVTVSVYRASGVAGANAALRAMHARVVVVPVRPGCPAIGSLPRPRPAPHPGVWVGSGVVPHPGKWTGSGAGKGGHRAVSVKIRGGIPKGDTMILAFSGNPRGGSAMGVGGIITGPVPSCVSLPPAPAGGGGTGSAGTG